MDATEPLVEQRKTPRPRATRTVRVYRRSLSRAALIVKGTGELWPDLVDRLLKEEAARKGLPQ